MPIYIGGRCVGVLSLLFPRQGAAWNGGATAIHSTVPSDHKLLPPSRIAQSRYVRPEK